MLKFKRGRSCDCLLYPKCTGYETSFKREIDFVPCYSRKVCLSTHNYPNNSKINFGYFGRLIPEKGIDVLCQLSEDPDLSDCTFHIWGEGNAYPAQYFQRFNNVHYHGSFSGLDELKIVLASIDIYLLLSTHPEGLPISLLEVMSAGIPWLATDRGGIPDIACDPASTRVISYTSTYDEIKEAVLTMKNDFKDGKISRVMQQRLYNSLYSAEIISLQWQPLLGLYPSTLHK